MTLTTINKEIERMTVVYGFKQVTEALYEASKKSCGQMDYKDAKFIMMGFLKSSLELSSRLAKQMERIS